MKSINNAQPGQPRLRKAASLAVLAAALAPLALATAAEGTGDMTSKPVKTAEAAKAKPKPATKKLSGAELYSMHCNRCHPERYPTERTAAQWKTILLHMRVRANLPAEQSRTILKYLQDNSGR